MPPEDEPQPTADERKSLTEWITRAHDGGPIAPCTQRTDRCGG